MQGTKDRTLEAATAAEPQSSGPRRTVVGGALALALLAGGVTAGALALGDDGAPQRAASTQDTLEQQPQQPQQQPEAPQDAGSSGQAPAGGTGSAPVTDPGGEPVRDAGAPDAVPAGTYGVRVLDEGWDARGRYVVLDRGRLTDGPAAEPGVDGTRPVVFDTGAVAERRRVDLADGSALRFARSGGEPSYGSGSWADFVTELSGRDDGMLATVQVDADGRLVSLEEPYRP